VSEFIHRRDLAKSLFFRVFWIFIRLLKPGAHGPVDDPAIRGSETDGSAVTCSLHGVLSKIPFPTGEEEALRTLSWRSGKNSVFLNHNMFRSFLFFAFSILHHSKKDVYKQFPSRGNPKPGPQDSDSLLGETLCCAIDFLL